MLRLHSLAAPTVLRELMNALNCGGMGLLIRVLLPKLLIFRKGKASNRKKMGRKQNKKKNKNDSIR
jgi:hypothetical protein